LVRVSGWLHTHIDDGGHAIVVTHALVIRAAMIDVLEAPRSAIWRIDVEPLGLVNLNSDGRRWMLRTATL
jgi:broad specificity phosphatase PhoE